MTTVGFSVRTQHIMKLHDQGLEVDVIAKRVGVDRPAVYKALRRLGILPGYKHREGIHRPALNKELPEIRYENRDPCFWCGSRGDYACGHGETI